MDWLFTRLFSLRVLAGFSAVGALIIALFSERDSTTLVFVFFSFLTILMVFLLLSGRIVFAIIGTWTIFTVITAISAAKLRYMQLDLHVVDAYFYLRNLEVIRFLGESFLFSLLFCLFILFLGIIVSSLSFFRSTSRPAFRVAGGVLIPVMLLGATLSYPKAATEIQFYTSGHNTSSFFASFGDVIGFLTYKPPIESQISAVVPHDAFNGISNCFEKTARPDVIIVLMESATPPSMYSEIKAPSSLKDEFQSNDGRIHKLRVETFGGATWVTTFGLMTSLPAVEFGWLRTYLPLYLQHRVHHSLPELMKTCGYRTVAISPFPYPFVNEGPFLRSLGIDDYLDSKVIHLPSLKARDSFYYNSALNFIRDHRKTDPRPLFMFIMTMSAHAPYDYRTDPDTKVPGEPFGNASEVDEYLRRLWMQRTDFKQFLQELKGKTSKDGAIILDFGDHQPIAVRSMVDLRAGWGSTGYLTYYNVTSIEAKLERSLPSSEVIDIEYLAPTLLEVAGLPMDDVYRNLIALRDSCAGAFVGCLTRERITLHLMKVVSGRLLELPN